MDTHLFEQLIDQEIETAMNAMFPDGDGPASSEDVRRHMQGIAKIAFDQGKMYAMQGLMTVADVAKHFGVSNRRARALIQNRHERLGIGMKTGKEWLIHRDELPRLKPDEKYRAGE